MIFNTELYFYYTQYYVYYISRYEVYSAFSILLYTDRTDIQHLVLRLLYADMNLLYADMNYVQHSVLLLLYRDMSDIQH